MDQQTLRSGAPLRRGEGPPPLACPTLNESLNCEVAIVGGGITGALAGYYLAQAGIDCVVLDREEIGACSTGLLQYEIDTPLFDLIQKVGEAHAVHAYRRGAQAIDALTKERA